MKILLQKVSDASVELEGETIGSIDGGYLLLVGVEQGDTEKEADWLIQKILNLRLFPSDDGKEEHRRTLFDVDGGLLVVSQFTLAANVQKGTRPDFSHAAAPGTAKKLYEYCIEQFRQKGVKRVETGKFGAFMQVSLTNTGPYTLWLERGIPL